MSGQNWQRVMKSVFAERFSLGMVQAFSQAVLVSLMIMLLCHPTSAQQAGSVTGLPVPRYVSLKTDKVNLREGPGKDYRATWVFQRAGLPVEITAESDTWRKIRDSEGSEGWVQNSLLSGRRTALVFTKKDRTAPIPLYTKPSESSDVVARLQPGVVTSIKTCNGSWCRIFGDGFEGYFSQTSLWGIYPGEKIE